MNDVLPSNYSEARLQKLIVTRDGVKEVLNTIILSTNNNCRYCGSEWIMGAKSCHSCAGTRP